MKEMYLKQISILLIIFYFEYSECWDESFHFIPCHGAKMEERMPVSMDNLIAIIEKYEEKYPNTDYINIASGILRRYRFNGIVYDPEQRLQWSTHQREETNKQDLDDKLLKPSFEFPENSFLPREECSLHMMTSHSIDLYPHAGVDFVWENPYPRKKRSYTELEPEKISEHPIEMGVVQTNAGPVAAGLLLSGIMAEDSSTLSVEDLLGKEKVKNFPKEMKQARIDPLYGATISGEIGQAAFMAGKTANTPFEIGPRGRFGNSTACPRIFTLETGTFSYMSRAEIFGSLDGFIIGTYLRSNSVGRLKLSEILRMYYTNHGLFNSELRACNRNHVLTKYIDANRERLKQEALYYMYAYQDYFSDIHWIIQQNVERFDEIQNIFKNYLEPVFSKFVGFMSSYSFDDSGYDECPRMTGDDVQTEALVDLLVVFSPLTDSTHNEKQAKYIAQTARKIGVGYRRSSLAVLDGRTAKFLEPVANISNIADFSCHYTEDVSFHGSSSQDFVDVMDALMEFYYNQYEKERQDIDHSGSRSQVVLWNLPNKFDGDDEDKIEAWNEFNATYPDVTFIFAGTRTEPIDLFYSSDYNNKIDLKFVSTQPIEPDVIAKDLTEEVKGAPRMFYYPACDTLKYEDYNEGRHVYTTFVSPNFTTFIRIPPQMFHFSEHVKLKFKSDFTTVCVSRTVSEPIKEEDEDIVCQEEMEEYEEYELCGRYVDECDPIYLSVTGLPQARSTGCNAHENECQYPNQIQFEITHEGMICSASIYRTSSMILLCILFVFHWYLEFSQFSFFTNSKLIS